VGNRDISTAQELADVSQFTRWVCRVRARTYTDERALSSLRVGLLTLLAEQASKQVRRGGPGDG
jgi:hypothetical protein